MEKEINEIKISIAVLQEQSIAAKDRDAAIHKKLDALVIQLNQSNHGREESLIFLKQSIKRKITATSAGVIATHNADVECVKEKLNSLLLFIWLGNHKKVLISLGLIILLSFGEKLNSVFRAYTKKQGVELIDKQNKNQYTHKL